MNVETLSGSLDEHLRAVMPPAPTRVALVGYPTHLNIGDQLIWAAQRSWLKRAGHRVTYVADHRTLDPKRLRTVDVVVIGGGGNLGDVWPLDQRMREDAVAAATGPVVQLPQTIHFADPDNEHRWLEVAARADLRLLVRDERSHATATRWGMDTRLAPDMAFALGRIQPAHQRRPDPLWLLRNDTEAPDTATAPEAIDWTNDPSTSSREIFLSGRALRYAERTGNQRLIDAAVTQWCRANIRRGIRMCSAPLVVTNRLHAHLLAVLLGTPTILLDNSYGKNRAVFDTWTGHLAGTFFADSIAQARDLERELLPALLDPS